MKINTLFGLMVLGGISFGGMFNVSANYSIELKEGYYWALDKSITTVTPIDAAELDGAITRQAMAKMISNFSINVLKKTPNTSRKCHFNDTDIADGLLPHVITSCQLGLMGQGIESFNPHSVVTRAEFGTILSRALWGDKYDQGKRHTFYERHLQALKEVGIMNDIDNPSQLELRGYVFLMLMRTAKLLKEIEWENPVKAKPSVTSSTGTVQTGDSLTGKVQTGNALTGLNTTGVVIPTNTGNNKVLIKTGSVNTGNIATGSTASTGSKSSELTKKEKKREEFEYTTEERIIYNVRSEKIYGVLYKPEKEGKLPIVIYSHGLGSNYESGAPYAKALAKAGVAVYLFDFRGGGSMSKSVGLTTEMSILTEKNDLESVLAEVQKWSFVDRDNIILGGASQGGAVTALVASTHSDIKGSILLYPAFSIPDLVKSLYPTVEEVEGNYNVLGVVVGKRYATDIWDLDFYKEIAEDEKPVLIVHGTLDPIVALSYAEKADETYKNSTLKKIEGGGHGFSGKYFDESVEYVLDYLQELGIIKQ